MINRTMVESKYIAMVYSLFRHGVTELFLWILKGSFENPEEMTEIIHFIGQSRGQQMALIANTISFRHIDFKEIQNT